MKTAIGTREVDYRFITVARLMRAFGLPWNHAEEIIREQTRRARRPWIVAAYLVSWLMCVAGVPLLVPAADHLLGVLLRIGGIGLMVACLLLPRLLARQAILDAAQARQAEPR